MTTADAQWLVATVIVGLCAGAAVFGAFTERSWLSLPSLVPVAAGLFIRTSGPQIRLPGHGGSEILRGGATIGYLERIAVVGAVGLAQVETVVAVIAIKGLGRFTELDSSAARERFIIGTLVSLLWSGLAAGLVWPPA
jgi:hypothetical protein